MDSQWFHFLPAEKSGKQEDTIAGEIKGVGSLFPRLNSLFRLFWISFTPRLGPELTQRLLAERGRVERKTPDPFSPMLPPAVSLDYGGFETRPGTMAAVRRSSPKKFRQTSANVCKGGHAAPGFCFTRFGFL